MHVIRFALNKYLQLFFVVNLTVVLSNIYFSEKYLIFFNFK